MTERAPWKLSKEQDATLGALNNTLKVSISPLKIYKEQTPLNSEEAVFLQWFSFSFKKPSISLMLIWTKTSQDTCDPMRL